MVLGVITVLSLAMLVMPAMPTRVPWLSTAAQAVAVTALLAIAWQRLKNIGGPRWPAVFSLVPMLNPVTVALPLSPLLLLHLAGALLNFGVICACLALPPGYAQHRRLDTAGRIVLGIFAVIFAALLVQLLMVLDILYGSN